ncbi:MAG: serine/threonine protein kinase [Deltaproteobacteria bacterium]|nr:serine/threonine protein kinase [Deltaproteobacteria bacterium]
MPHAPPPPPAADATLVGGRYRLTEIIGRGGMSVVWRAWDERLGVERAVKLLDGAVADRAGVRQRFLAEASTTARLHHPGIVAVQDLINEDRIAIVMELLRGGTLWQRVEAQGPLSEHEAIALMIPIVDAVGAAHAAGVVHRDIKPQNILLTQRGEPKLSDFGIAQVANTFDMADLTRTGAVLGTFGFMSPEQRVDASRVDASSDIYALGATLWALVRGKTPTDLFAADLEPGLLDGLSPPLAAVVRACTRYRAADRPGSAEQLAAALSAVLPGAPRDALPRPQRPALRPPPVDEHTPPLGSDTMVDLLHGDDEHHPTPRPTATVEPPAPVRPAPPPARAGRPPWVVVGLLLVLAVGLGVAGSTLVETWTEVAPVAPEPAPKRPRPRPAPSGPGAPATPATTDVSPPTSGETTDPVEVPGPASEEPGEAPTSPPEGEPPPVEPPTSPPDPPEPSDRRPPPEPAPVPAPAPLPSPDPMPAPVPIRPTGFISFDGAVLDPELEDRSGGVYSPGEVPAGVYTVRASFGPEQPRVVVAEVEVRPQQRLRMRCDRSFQKCSPR